MAFFIASSPHSHQRRSTQDIMMNVILCTLPGILTLCYFFGWGVLFQVLLASITAIVAEGLVAFMRQRPPLHYLKDHSALLTGILIGIAIPPLAPWWIAVIGSIFAIVIAKHLYGGLGQNPFNPAMIAYVVLLISFPVQMTTWLPPLSILPINLSLADTALSIFTGFTFDGFSVHQLRFNVDGMTMATPLDTVKTGLTAHLTLSEIYLEPVFGMFTGKGWGAVNLAFMIGGLILIKRHIIQWHIPVSFLASLALCSGIGYSIDPEYFISPVITLFSGASMLGAFFIATDPVSAATTPKGRIIYGSIIGALVYIIRTFGGFPDGVAFAVLLANICVPLIDYYTKPRAYGSVAKKAQMQKEKS